MPTQENLGQLVAHAYKTERLSGTRLDWISGGASSSLTLLLEGRLPAGINNLRVGEAILQGGVETFRETPWAELEPDACRLTSDIIEVKLKPSLPIGQSGYDAFGNQPVFRRRWRPAARHRQYRPRGCVDRRSDADRQGRAGARRLQRPSAARCDRCRSATRRRRSRRLPHELWRHAAGDDLGICRKGADARRRGFLRPQDGVDRLPNRRRPRILARQRRPAPGWRR